MATSMRKQMNRTRGGALFFGLIAGVSLACAASCVPSDGARGSGRVEPPRDPGPSAPPSTSAVPPLAPAPITSAPVTTPPLVELPLSPSETFEQRSGLKLSALDKAIFDECPERAWTQNVPKRLCKNDGECGDGFCDRGRCAARRTCGSEYGRQCEKQVHCSFLPCLNGRCRSCVAEAECDWKRDQPGVSNVTCRSDYFTAGARRCVGSIGSVLPTAPRE